MAYKYEINIYNILHVYVHNLTFISMKSIYLYCKNVRSFVIFYGKIFMKNLSILINSYNYMIL